MALVLAGHLLTHTLLALSLLLSMAGNMENRLTNSGKISSALPHNNLRRLSMHHSERGGGQTSSIMELLRQYSMSHDIQALQADPNACSRRYVLVSYPELDSLGNNIYSFLNGYLLAVLFDRTVVLAAPRHAVPFRTPPWETNWIIDLPTLRNIWEQRSCNYDLRPVIIGTPTKIERLICCGEKIIDFTMISVCLNHHNLYQMSSERANLTSSHRAIAGILFSVDEYALYGLLLRHAFSIPPPGPRVKKALQRISAPIVGANRPITFGLHVRHYETDPVYIEVDIIRAAESIRRAYAVFVPKGDRLCIVLLAANRPEILESHRIADTGCSVVCVERPPLDQRIVNNSSEHGVWANSDIEIDDVNLLSMADVFIGSNIFKNAHSTFSVLIADLMSSAKTENGAANIFWINDIMANSSVPWDISSRRSNSMGKLFTDKGCEHVLRMCWKHENDCSRHEALLELQGVRIMHNV